ncbi:hypothetical protein AVEN_25674-1 [Araneus ventricosus]|uniref:Uncharacterized protein n=1 Tax=Araneus ventricosus TaxID=182803 RepID=A0A4Y2M8R3_ARAVE|nr:hypothetical protein AVEN_25674-1 [Araneus ventricosus]
MNSGRFRSSKKRLGKIRFTTHTPSLTPARPKIRLARTEPTKPAGAGVVVRVLKAYYTYPHKHSITGWQVTLPAFLLLVPELFEKMKLVLFSRFNQDALENYFSRWTYYILLHRTRMLLAELMFAMCGNANYEPDDDIILESTQIIPQTDEDCLDLVFDEPS